MPAEIELGPFSLEHPELTLALILGLVLLAVIYKPLMSFLGFPRLELLVPERSAKVEEVQKQAGRALGDVKQVHDDYAARLLKIEGEQRVRIDAAVQESSKARADIIADAQIAAIALQRRAEEEIARETTRQRILLRQQLVQMTLGAAEQTVRDHNSPTMQRQLIASFIQQLGGTTITPTGGSAIAAPQPALPVESPISTPVISPVGEILPTPPIGSPTTEFPASEVEEQVIPSFGSQFQSQAQTEPSFAADTPNPASPVAIDGAMNTAEWEATVDTIQRSKIYDTPDTGSESPTAPFSTGSSVESPSSASESVDPASTSTTETNNSAEGSA